MLHVSTSSREGTKCYTMLQSLQGKELNLTPCYNLFSSNKCIGTVPVPTIYPNFRSTRATD